MHPLQVLQITVSGKPPHKRSPKPMWLGRLGKKMPSLEQIWRCYLRQFAVDYWNRFAKQRLHWTLPPNLILPPQAPTIPQVPNLGPGTITVNRFEVVGSTVFSPQTLAKVTAPFTNRPISFAELLQAHSAVTQL